MNIESVGTESWYKGLPDDVKVQVDAARTQLKGGITKVDLSDPVDEIQLSKKEGQENVEEKKPSLIKKAGISASSYYCPGLGQIMNGEYLKGVAMYAASKILPDKLVGIYSAYDAYKNVK